MHSFLPFIKTRIAKAIFKAKYALDILSRFPLKYHRGNIYLTLKWPLQTSEMSFRSRLIDSHFWRTNTTFVFWSFFLLRSCYSTLLRWNSYDRVENSGIFEVWAERQGQSISIIQRRSRLIYVTSFPSSKRVIVFQQRARLLNILFSVSYFHIEVNHWFGWLRIIWIEVNQKFERAKEYDSRDRSLSACILTFKQCPNGIQRRSRN